MREAVIVSYARTGLAKAGRGGFNVTPPMSMAAHAIKHAVAKSGVEADFVEDCYLGNNAHGAANIARLAALLAGGRTTPGIKHVSAEQRDLFRRPLEVEDLKSFDGAVFDPPRAGAAAQVAVLARAPTLKRLAAAMKLSDICTSGATAATAASEP